MSNAFIFLDKDGTLIKDVPYNVDPKKIVFETGAAAGLRRLSEAGFRFVIVSNQAGVARGCFEESALKTVESHLRSLLRAQAGITLDGFYYCPHHPQGSVAAYAVACDCRKPQPGMLLKAAQDLKIDLKASWMIGDILNDVEAGNRAGCRTILIENGNETEWEPGPFRTPDFKVKNLIEAADTILSTSAPTSSTSVQNSISSDYR